jgi:hypothetical protein
MDIEGAKTPEPKGIIMVSFALHQTFSQIMKGI